MGRKDKSVLLFICFLRLSLYSRWNAQEQKSAVGTRIWKKIFFAQIFRKEKNLEREMLYFRLIFKKGR